MKKNNILSSKIAKYSLMAGAAITMLSACKKEEEESDYDYTDVNPDVSLTASLNSSVNQSFDLNADGINDVEFVSENYSYTNYGYTNASKLASFNGLNGAKVISQTQVVEFYPGYSYDFDVVTPLASGNPISASQSAWIDTAYLGGAGTYYGSPISIGFFLGTEKFVGVSLIANGNTYYAWMRVALSADGGTITFKDYAVHKNSNAAITAGSK